MVESIAEKSNLPPEEVESRLIALSVDIALLPEKVLSVIDSNTSLARIPDLVKEKDFTEKLESCEAYYSNTLNICRQMEKTPAINLLRQI